MTDTLRKAAQALIERWYRWEHEDRTLPPLSVLREPIEPLFATLRTALAQPEDVMVRFISRINQEMDGLLHDKAHTDTGKVRAAQSVRTPEMSYRPGSLPMEADINQLCAVMIRHGLATGHGDTMAQVIEHLDLGLTEIRSAEDEPVAHGVYNKKGKIGFVTLYPDEYPKEKIVPLFTHPQPLRDLTDDEIFAVENAVPDDIIGDRAWTLYFARAIIDAARKP